MDLRQEYKKAYEALDGTIQERIENKRYAALGYTSNLDLLCDFQVGQLNLLLEEYMQGETLSEMRAAERIHTMRELLETVVYFCSRGIGGEVDVENVELVESSLSFGYGMGGTATQAAMALDEVGCPTLVHLTDDSPEVCRLLDTPRIYTVSQKGEIVHTGGITQTHEQEPHFIIQFKKGDIIRLGEQAVEIPCSNRLILTKVTVNEFVPFFKPYFEWIEKNAEHVSSNVLSSFNALTNPDILKERLEYVKGHVERYRRNNPDGIVFFEDAHYHNISVKKLCLETIYSSVDIVSLNEEELNYTLNEMYQHKVDIDDILSCVEGAKFIRSQFGIRKGVIIHTKDYSMYVGEPLKADIRRGLMYGNMMATAKASIGWYGGLEQIAEVLKYELSPKGEKHYHTILESKYKDEVVLVPSKYLDKPKYTIGLGDSFVGGVQICF